MSRDHKVLLYSLLISIICVTSACKEPKAPGKLQTINLNPKMDTARVESALRAFEALPPETKGKAVILKKILEDAIAMGYNDQSCYLAMDLARGQADLGNFDSTYYYYQLARKFCYQPIYDKSITAYFLSEMGAFYYGLRSDHVSANACYYEALSYLKANKMDDQEIAIPLYIFLYGTQMKLGHPQQAFAYLRESEKLSEQLDSKQGLMATWNNLGEYYLTKNNSEKANEYYQRSLGFESYVWDPNIWTSALMGKGHVHLESGQIDSAIIYFERARDYARKNKVVYTEVEAIIAIGSAYNKQGGYSRTIKLLSPFLDGKAKGIENNREEGYKVLVEAYEGNGNFKKALDIIRAWNSWKDSVENVNKQIALNEMEVKFQTASKDKDIVSKGLLIEQQKNKLNKKNAWIAFISVAAIVAVLVLFILYKNASHKQKVRELEYKTLESQQEIDMLRSTMQGEEQERQRLSRELHDGIGSMVSSAIMRLSLLKKKDPGSISGRDLEEVMNLLQETGTEIRKTAQNLMPDVIYKQTLSEAVRNYCETVSQSNSIKIDTVFLGSSHEFSGNCKLIIYRIIQELLHNVVKHAKATHVIVQAIQNDGRFNLTIEDNGTGFDTHMTSTGMGLKNVMARVKSLNGDFQVDSIPGKGTTFYMEFDCEHLHK